MAKFCVGDVVVFTRRHHEDVIAQVEKWRGGGVAPYQVRILKGDYFYKTGEISYKAGRDMELKAMQGKKKIYCCVPGCSTYSFESKGTIQWQCHNHCPAAFNEQDTNNVSLEEKVDLILAHLGLEVTTKPAEIMLTEKPKNND